MGFLFFSLKIDNFQFCVEQAYHSLNGGSLKIKPNTFPLGVYYFLCLQPSYWITLINFAKHI